MGIAGGYSWSPDLNVARGYTVCMQYSGLAGGPNVVRCQVPAG